MRHHGDAAGLDRRRLLGDVGERLARQHLEAAGYEIVDANFRSRHGELDVVATSDRFLVFCEVKTRIEAGGASIGPLAAIGHDKRRRVRLMARRWLAERGRRTPSRPAETRFDAIGVTLDVAGRLLALEHVQDAF